MGQIKKGIITEAELLEKVKRLKRETIGTE